MTACENCKFFEQVEATQGTCRRMPPKPFPTGPDQISSFWPSVQPTQWCGEHVVRIEIARVMPTAPKPLAN